MAKTDIKIYSTEAASGKKTTTSITYVNPDANSQTLKTFAQKLNAFTTNNYVETDRIHTINVDTEQVPTDIQEGTITLIDNATGRIVDNSVLIDFNNILVNGEVLTTAFDTRGIIWGMLQTPSGTKYVMENVPGSTYVSASIGSTPVTGNYSARLVIDKKDGYTAGAMSTTKAVRVSS